MTPKLSDIAERISPEDLAWTMDMINALSRLGYWRTYAFNITSDTLTDSEETQS